MGWPWPLVSITLGVIGVAAYVPTLALSTVLGLPGLVLGIPGLRQTQGRVRVLTYVGLGLNAFLSAVFVWLINAR